MDECGTPLVCGPPILIALLVILILMVVGFFVVNAAGYEIGFISGFCYDKEGMVNISEFNTKIMYSQDLINCSLCNEGRCFSESLSVVTSRIIK